ncbi:MAG: hypothetical protein H5T82_10335, partial [Demequina sp.]|nr:hypothetical protein [Demequina sp.]
VKCLVPALARLLSAARLAPVRPFVTDALESLAMVRQRTYVGEQVKALGS